MTVLNIIFNCAIKKWATFKGRTNRKEFIVFTIFFYTFIFATVSFEKEIREIFKEQFEEQIVLRLLLSLFLLFLMIKLIVSNLSVTIRRLHDINLSGWWYILLGLNPLLLITTIILCFLKGTPSPNRYGTPLD